MQNKFLMMLPLAAALAVPALAQDAAPASQQDQPQAPASQTVSPDQPQSSMADKQAQPTATGREPLVYERKEGFWGKINPFARKKYVQRQLDPVRGRVNELDELTASNSRMIKDVDARATEGIRLAHNKANEADLHAVEAGNRAQMAHQTAAQANQRLETVQQAVENVDQYQLVSEAEIRFRPGQLALSKRAKEALDEMAQSLADQKGYIIEVQGFSSGSGQAAIHNSQNMAEAVVRYLVLNHDIPVYRIFTLGMGNAPVKSVDGSKPRRTSGGRVEIALLKNGVAELAQAQPLASPQAQSAAQPQQQAAAQPQQKQ